MNTSDMRIDFTSVDQLITKLNQGINELDDVFKKQAKNYVKLNATDVWYGTAQLACSSKYEKISKKYELIINSLKQYSDFLKETNATMRDFERSVDQAVDTDFGGGVPLTSGDGDHEEEVLV